MICEVCGKSLVKEIKLFNSVVSVPVLCACEIEKRNQAEEYEKNRQKELLIKRMRKNGIRDNKASRYTFSLDDGTGEKIEMAKRYVDKIDEMISENIGLLLTGNVGSGKSFTAGCICNALIDKGISSIFINLSTVLNDLTNFTSEGVDRNEYIYDLNQCQVLVIDDFGIERQSAFASEQIFNLVDSRIRKNKPLIVTTNITLGTLKDEHAPMQQRRIYDRLLGSCVPIVFNGKSRRKTESIQKMDKMKDILNGT